MRKLFFCAMAVAAGMLVSADIYATRPVWLLGHRCNSMDMIRYVLEDGGNGVEIDVRTGNTNGSHWSVAHDTFVEEKKCDDSKWMSLKTLLNKDLIRNDGRFCLLFIDVKDTKYIKELVEYVHKVNNYTVPKYYILYGMNLVKMKDIPLDDIKYLANNLYSNEGFATQNDGNIGGIINKLKEANCPPEKFCYVDGYFLCASPVCKYNNLQKALEIKKKGEMCVRTGFWTCQWAYQARNSYLSYKGKDVCCDFNLVECRGWGASYMFRYSLHNTYKEYLKDKQYGICVATRDDNFWSRTWY